MSDTETKTVRAKILREFTDAGSERRFTPGDTVTIAEGEFVNYQAARLVEAAPDEPAAVADTKVGRTRN